MRVRVRVRVRVTRRVGVGDHARIPGEGEGEGEGEGWVGSRVGWRVRGRVGACGILRRSEHALELQGLAVLDLDARLAVRSEALLRGAAAHVGVPCSGARLGLRVRGQG